MDNRDKSLLVIPQEFAITLEKELVVKNFLQLARVNFIVDQSTSMDDKCGIYKEGKDLRKIEVAMGFLNGIAKKTFQYYQEKKQKTSKYLGIGTDWGYFSDETSSRINEKPWQYIKNIPNLVKMTETMKVFGEIRGMTYFAPILDESIKVHTERAEGGRESWYKHNWYNCCLNIVLTDGYFSDMDNVKNAFNNLKNQGIKPHQLHYLFLTMGLNSQQLAEHLLKNLSVSDYVSTASIGKNGLNLPDNYLADQLILPVRKKIMEFAQTAYIEKQKKLEG